MLKKVLRQRNMPPSQNWRPHSSVENCTNKLDVTHNYFRCQMGFCNVFLFYVHSLYPNRHLAALFRRKSVEDYSRTCLANSKELFRYYFMSYYRFSNVRAQVTCFRTIFRLSLYRKTENYYHFFYTRCMPRRLSSPFYCATVSLSFFRGLSDYYTGNSWHLTSFESNLADSSWEKLSTTSLKQFRKALSVIQSPSGPLLPSKRSIKYVSLVSVVVHHFIYISHSYEIVSHIVYM